MLPDSLSMKCLVYKDERGTCRAMPGEAGIVYVLDGGCPVEYMWSAQFRCWVRVEPEEQELKQFEAPELPSLACSECTV